MKRTDAVSPAMRTVLRSLEEHQGEGITEVLYDFEDAHFGRVKNEGGKFHLADKALDKVLDALLRRRLIVKHDGYYYVTDTGRAALQ